ncbi:hypothetical protein N0V90_006937 [Kalmusia sp. IMI 367209]|nr:hypothetical protein N0V90_006937 [Kalmusia sp. IMI 367209]
MENSQDSINFQLATHIPSLAYPRNRRTAALLKKKGNPIITRYPPPPGYRGPAQPQGPLGANQYQPPQQGYPQVSAPYPGQPYQGPPTPAYSPQTYGPPQSYPSQQTFAQAGYQQPQNYNWAQKAQQSHPSQTPGTQPPNYPTQSYPQQQVAYQQFPNQPPPINTNQPAWPNPQGWQHTPASATYPTTNQYNAFGGPTNGQSMSDPNATPTPSSANPSISQSTPTTAQPTSATSDNTPVEKPPLFLGWDDWDFDFDGAIWPKANEPVDPNLSLGVITWRPAKQVTRALPPTFEEAEEQSFKPPAEKLGNGESVSLYFTAENSYEAFLDVRRTDEWENIKNDPAFVVFTGKGTAHNLVSIEDCLALRDRPDEPTEEFADNGDEDMHDPTWNVMDNLEQALSDDVEDIKKPIQQREPISSTRDQTQEDVLARLGVTGSPKPVYEDPLPVSFLRDDKLPASLPVKPPAPPSANIPPRPEAPPQRAQSFGGQHNSTFANTVSRPYGPMFSAYPQHPPLTPHADRLNPWNSISQTNPQGNSNMPAGLGGSSVLPEANNKSTVGSDFSPDKTTNNVDKDTAAVSSLKRGDSSFTRKRSYEDTDQEDEHVRQHDDHSKRKRRSVVDAAYR